MAFRRVQFRSIRARITAWAGLTLFLATGIVAGFAAASISALASEAAQRHAIPAGRATSLVWQMGGIGALSIVLALVCLWIGAGRIARPIQRVTELAETAASGDLQVQAELESDGGTGALAHAFNQMIILLRGMIRDEQEARAYVEMRVQEYLEYESRVAQGDLTALLDVDDAEWLDDDALTVLGRQLNITTTSLKEMILRIREASGQLSTTSTEILAATTQQASGSSEQAAAISQATITVDEIQAIVEQMVLRSQNVADMAKRSVEVTQTGQEVVRETIAGMENIKMRVEGIAENILALSEKNRQIGDIITTVSDIASQSNMLALNASVEAARAGEQGKGFAVVALEVRNLAEQSKQATAQIATILSEIQTATNASVMATEEGTKGVEEGVRLVAQTEEVIQHLAGVITESAGAAVQMVAGGQQQSSGIEQIALAMGNINQATAQSLASTRQAERAAQDLNGLAHSLAETVEQYQTNGRDCPATRQGADGLWNRGSGS